MAVPRAWFLLMLVGLDCGCSSHEAPPPLAKCSADGCNPATGINTGQPGGGASGISDAGGNGTSVSLNVSVVSFTDSSADSLAWSLSGVRGIGDVVEVQAPAATATVGITTSPTISTATGPSPLTLLGVSTSIQDWASARPTSTGSIYLPGIIGLSISSDSSVNVPLLLVDDFAFIPSLFNSTAPSLDRTKAQVVVKVVDDQGNGVRNAKIADIGAAAMAYSSAGTWVDTSSSPSTDASGRVIAINLPASSTPGGFVTITASGTNASGSPVTASVLMPIEAGFVTYGTIALILS